MQWRAISRDSTNINDRTNKIKDARTASAFTGAIACAASPSLPILRVLLQLRYGCAHVVCETVNSE